MGLLAVRGGSLEDILYTLFALVLVLFTSMPIHEYAHAWVAYQLGDDTAARLGRLDLNPLHHIDPMGGLLLLLVGFGWAKPVPVNPSRFTRKISLRAGMALTSLAGPLANLLLGLILMLCYKLLIFGLYAANIMLPQMEIVVQIFIMMISINVGLAIFNLLPIPPLDGSKIFSFFFPKLDDFLAQYQRILYPILFFVLVATPILDVPLNIARSLVYQGMDFLTGWVDMLFNLVL